ncbi:MAG: hypothetical protein WCY65_01915 [Candidatus Methanomethylophilaceae archaeon]
MSGLRINVISLAGTDRRLAQHDLDLAKVIRDGLERLGVDAFIEFADLSVARHRADRSILDQIFPLYREKGCGISPAYFLNGELICHGRIPSVEEFMASITDRFDLVEEEEQDA